MSIIQNIFIIFVVLTILFHMFHKRVEIKFIPVNNYIHPVLYHESARLYDQPNDITLRRCTNGECESLTLYEI